MTPDQGGPIDAADMILPGLTGASGVGRGDLPRVVILAYDGVNLLDLSGPLGALYYAGARPDLPWRPRYDIVVASLRGGMVRTTNGLALETRPLGELDGLGIDTVIVPGGSVAGHPPEPADLVDWMRRHAPDVRRVCSVCSGAFLLAAAGLLDGRRATTHWFWAQTLGDRFPEVRVEADKLFVVDGPIWTSGGMTAGIDMALALIEQDRGHAEAISTARGLVMFMKRPGGQAQFSTTLDVQARSDGAFSDLHGWIRQNLARRLKVSDLAEKAGMTERTFTRAYQSRIGQSPLKVIESLRIEAACELLTSKNVSVKQVAASVGFGAEQNMRRVFMRRLGVTPGEYRERF
jgi:transcriptional regulator GlxA family with amidase domain